jgi:zinc-finger of a C2HC-type
MFNQKASPIRSAKSGNSTTSSTNSVRSMASPKMVSSGQTTTRNVSDSTVKPRAPAVKSGNTSQSSFEEPDEGPVPEGLVRCGICKRNFAEDRIDKHQTVCQKNKTKKRKVYDASKKRVQVSSTKRQIILLITPQVSILPSTGN